MIELDHIFIFSEQAGAEAEQLVQAGFQEGSSRVHPGQGTTNRKFYVENFFLEILWVHDEEELQSPATRATRLWERAHFRQTGASRFGLCLVNTPETDRLFAQAAAYQPRYFPEGMAIDILHHATTPSLPWTFRLPFTGPKKEHQEPTSHANGISKLTHAQFGLSAKATTAQLVHQLAGEQAISFMTQGPGLVLSFDHQGQGKTLSLPDLDLEIRY